MKFKNGLICNDRLGAVNRTEKNKIHNNKMMDLLVSDMCRTNLMATCLYTNYQTTTVHSGLNVALLV